MKKCDVCLSESPDDCVKHLSIFLHGSEGVSLCDDCMMGLTNHLRHLRSVAGRAVRSVHIAAKRKDQP